jgi:hypothetical protein
VLEESTLMIRPLTPPATYWIGPGGDETTMAAAPWDGDPAEPVPLLVGRRGEPDARKLSVTYLAMGEGHPAPAAETQGLLLLCPADVPYVAHRRPTLGAFLRDGGQAILRTNLPPHLRLTPLTQLRALAILLERHPRLLAA